MPKRKSSLTAKLQEEFPFLRPMDHSGFDAVCSICNSSFSVRHGGRSDVNDHVQSKKHKAGITAKSSSSTVNTFFRKHELGSDEHKLAAAEGTFAYHTIQHNHSFRSMDCTSKLVKKMYDPKFAMARTKSEAIVVNVLYPYINSIDANDIKDSKFISLAVDTSNHNSTKLAPVLIRYFKPSTGIKTKIIEFSEIEGETSEIICDHVMSVIDKYNLTDKIIAFSTTRTQTSEV